MLKRFLYDSIEYVLINRESFLATIIIAILTIAIFWQFFLKNLYPFPGDYMLAWYEPWKSSHFSNGSITIAHKPVADDVFRQLYPFKILAMDIVKQGKLPLWNPYNGSGMPLMATMHVGYLNPFNMLFLFLSDSLAWSIYIMLQPFLIGICMYLYLRKINLQFFPAIFSTLIFVLSGFVITRLIFGDYDYAIVGLPLLMYLIEHFMQNPRSKRILLLPFVVFFVIAATQPQIIAYILSFVFLYILYRRLERKTVLFLVFLFVTGIGLSAIQLIPTLELFQQAALNPASSKFIIDHFLLPIGHFITILIPNYFGNQATYNYWGAADYIESVGSLGTIACFFAILSIGGRVNTYVKHFYIAAFVITILLCLNWVGSRLLYSIPLPILSTSVPSRILFLTTFSLSVLAGYGFEEWLSLTKISKVIVRKMFLFSLGIIVLIAVTFLLYILHVSCNNPVIFACRTIALRNTIFETSIFFASLLFFYFYIRYKKVFLVDKFPILMGMVIVFLGLYNSNKFLPFSKRETFAAENALIQMMREKTQYDRIFGIGEASVKTNFATYFKFYDPNYYDPLYNKWYGELVSYANTGKVNAPLPRSDVEITNELTVNDQVQKRRVRLLNILGISSLIFKKSEIKNDLIDANAKLVWEDKNWYIRKNTAALPRAYLVSKIEIRNSKEEILKRVFDTSFDPKTTVILEKKPHISLEKKPVEKTIVTIKTYKENNVLINVSTKQNGLLVLSDNYYPGWKALIDGQKTPIYRANYSFRAIEIAKGNHEILFSYEPDSIKIGFLVTVFSLVIFFATVLKYDFFTKT